jgi:hypothetical protein
MQSTDEKKKYHSPKLVELGSHSSLVAAGGDSTDIDGTYLRDGLRFATFGTS